MPATKALPEVEGLFTTPDDTGRIRLITGTCAECAAVFFPARAALHRPGCSGGPVEQTLLSPTGTLVSWTVQRYQPPEPYPAPKAWEPVAIGTAAFAEGLQIPAQLAGIEPDAVRVGIVVETVAEPLYTDGDGVTRLTWKFRPVGPASENGAV